MNKPRPAPLNVFSETSVTLGATPEMPTPLIGAPTALIVQVPWPLKSWMVGSLGTKEWLSTVSRFAATSM